MKEYVIILIFLLYIIYYIITNWGKKYTFVGIKDTSRIPTTKEEMCRSIFEKIFESKFEKIRPDFLRNDKTGRNLELDGYNPNIITPIGSGLGFEYNGEQHYKYVDVFHKSIDDLTRQQERDALKIRLCKKNETVLITIPYTVKSNGLESFIIRKLIENGLHYYISI